MRVGRGFRTALALPLAGSWIVVVSAGAGAAAQSNKAAAPPAASAKPAPAAAPVSADPASTSASYGDWVLRCQRVGEGDKAQRLCEVAQTIQVQGQQQPIAQVAFGKLAAADPLRLTVVLPSNITLPSSVTVAPADKDAAPTELAWRRCIPGGCVADASPTAEALKAFRAAPEPGRLTFKDAAGREVALPLSFRGLPQALDALAKG